MRSRRLSRALRRGVESVVGRKEGNIGVVVVKTVMRRTARRSMWPAARGGWAGDVTGGLQRTFPGTGTFSKFHQRGLEDRWRPKSLFFLVWRGPGFVRWQTRCGYCINYSRERRDATTWIYN